MKKILFITYFWPPSGKASLYWPLNIIKYLFDYDIKSTVLTVENESFTRKDDSLSSIVDKRIEVHKSKTYEPFAIYKRFIGKAQDEQLTASETISKTNKSFAHKVSIWIRINLFIPDARIGWHFSAVKKGNEILKREKFDAIVSIGPPHSSHLIARSLSKKNNVPYIPVLIDPWVDIIYYKDFKRSNLTLKIDNNLERKVLKDSIFNIFVTETTLEDYIAKYPSIKNKSDVLFWGYNGEDFEGLNKNRLNSDKKILLHAGNIFDYQNPKNLWKTIKQRIDSGENLEINFIGTISPAIKNSIIEAGLENHFKYLGFLNFRDMLQKVLNADYLMVGASEKRHLPGKLYEYLKAGNPILAFGDDNIEMKKILTETNAGKMFSYQDNCSEFFSNADTFKTNQEKIKKFDRKEIAKKFAEILNKTL